MKKYILPILVIAVLTGCKKKEDETTVKSVPSTYNFENVSYTGQTTRLNQLAAIKEYIASSHTTNGALLSAETLDQMYSGSGFSNAELNGTGKQLRSKTYVEDTTYYDNLIDSIAAHCQITGAENGKAGIIETSNRTILVDANGMEYAQLFEKGIMGSCFYYQATSYYLTDEKIGSLVDNTTVTEGKGTDKEHHFDEAFGYFGAPVDFPTNTIEAIFWAKYCYKRDADLGTNKIMDAFLKARFAISNKNETDQNEAVTNIKMYWEKVSAATAIHYLNEAKGDDFADDADRCHVLTEAYAFIQALKKNIDRSITNAQVDAVLDALGDNFWDVTKQDIEDARDLLATAAGLESEKENL